MIILALLSILGSGGFILHVLWYLKSDFGKNEVRGFWIYTGLLLLGISSWMYPFYRQWGTFNDFRLWPVFAICNVIGSIITIIMCALLGGDNYGKGNRELTVVYVIGIFLAIFSIIYLGNNEFGWIIINE